MYCWAPKGVSINRFYHKTPTEHISRTLSKMTPFFLSRNSNGSGSSGFDDDDDDIDRAMHRTNHHRLLKYTTDLIPQHNKDNSSVVAALSAMKEDNNNNTNNTMTRAISMLEMNDIHDMVQFGEAVSALDVSPPPPKKTTTTKNNDDDDDDNDVGGFFIDSSDRSHSPPSCDGDNNNNNIGGKNNFLQMPPQENAPSTTTNVNVGGMRRVVSMATLSSSSSTTNNMNGSNKNLNLLSAMVQDIILEEEGEDNNHCRNNNNTAERKKKEEKENTLSYNVEVQEARDVQSPPSPLSEEENDARNCVGAVYDIPLSVEEDRDTSTKPPRRSGSTGSNNNHMNMPLRSSLKKDSMNSLRSSLSKSAGSIGSEGDGSSIKSNSMKRNVSFSSLEIRQYNVTLGDAPCSNAISLDWKYDPTATEQHNIDQYERYRTDEAPRRVRSELVMTPAHRKYLLMREAGFSRHEINAAMKEARRVAKQREQTARYVRRGYQPYEEMLERTKRKLGKIGSIGGDSKRKELSS